MNRVDRRKLLLSGATVLGASAIAAGIGWWYRARRAPHAGMETGAIGAGAFSNALHLPGSSGVLGILDVSAPLTIVAKFVQHAIVEGKPGPLLAYHVEQDGKTWINPILRLRSGSTFKATLRNAFDEETIIHWHGLEVDDRNDAHPRFVIGPGKAYEYEFQVRNRAGTYWYHPHPHGLTGAIRPIGRFLAPQARNRFAGCGSHDAELRFVTR